MRAYFLFLFPIFGTAFAQDPVVSDPLVAAIQAEVDALNSGDDESLGATVAWPELLHEFYTHRSFKPAWTDLQTASQLRRAIEDSRLDGLDPADYHLPQLQKMASELSAPQAGAGTRARYDVLQTDALLRLAYHLALGKVDPTTFDAQWNYARTAKILNVEQSVEDTLAKGNVYERLDALRPTHRLYATLKREYARYLSAQAHGVPANVPMGAAIKPGASDDRVPALRARLIASGDLATPTESRSLTYDSTLQQAARRFQSRMGLSDDAVIGGRTLEELNVPIAERINQLRVNLDRGRVLLHDLPHEFVVVNIASYQIYLLRDSDIVWQARVQVGKPYRRTPMFRSEITYLVWNPTWTVPPGIIRNDTLPKAKRDPRSIAQSGLDVFDASGRKLDPTTIDWSQYRNSVPYTLRQAPGPKNALGRVKFMFPNPYLVYLHDTPSRALFASDDRSFSSGCVRVERPIELALLLLKDPNTWNDASVAATIETQRTTNVTLPEKIPLLLTYWTAWVDAQDRVNFRRDVYGQDKQWAAGLDRPFTVRKQPLLR